MQAIRLALMIFCVVMGMTILNSVGVMDTYRTPDNVLDPNTSSADNIVELNSGSSDTEINNYMSGWGAIANGWNLFKQFMSILVLPGPYAYANGCPATFAVCIQAIVTLIELIGGFQIITRFNLGGAL
jgi:hypothetical protein